MRPAAAGAGAAVPGRQAHLPVMVSGAPGGPPARVLRCACTHRGCCCRVQRMPPQLARPAGHTAPTPRPPCRLYCKAQEGQFQPFGLCTEIPLGCGDLGGPCCPYGALPSPRPAAWRAPPRPARLLRRACSGATRCAPAGSLPGPRHIRRPMPRPRRLLPCRQLLGGAVPGALLLGPQRLLRS